MAASLDELKDIMGFDNSDLQANRQGELSIRQKTLYTPGTLTNIAQSGCFAVATIGSMAGCPAILALEAWRAYLTSGGTLVLVALFAVIAIGGGSVGLRAARQEYKGSRETNRAMQRDVDANRVASAQVVITTDEVGEHRYAVNKADDIWLFVDNPVMQPGERYIAYYLPESNWLISAEPLTD